MYLAAVAPPRPASITTTRGPDFGAKSPLVEAAQPARPPPASTPRPTPNVRRNPLRVIVLMALLLLGDGCVREFPVLDRERRESTSADATASSELRADRLLDPLEHRLRRALQMHPPRQGRWRVLDPGPGQDEHNPGGGLDLPFLLHGKERGQRPRHFGRAPHAFHPGEPALGPDDFLPDD